MKSWVVALYKINEINILKRNLHNQEYEYYIPTLTTVKINKNPKEEIFFPGYAFININLNAFSALRYTKAIKDIIKFSNRIAIITDDEIEKIRLIEKQSKITPIESQITPGMEATINKGPLKGMLAKIASLPSEDRVYILLSLLGDVRRVEISLKDINT